MCGNFGLLLLDPANRHLVEAILSKMITVTMVRGAQSGGILTYVEDYPRRRRASVNDKQFGGRTASAARLGRYARKSICARVVNGKRSNLSKLIMGALRRKRRAADCARILTSTPRTPTDEPFSALFQGHTRFATSSVADLSGTHPHSWTRARVQTYNVRLDDTGRWARCQVGVENWITHNGDLDAFRINGVIHPTETIMQWLERATFTKRKTDVDSAAIAGLLDVLRCKGMWFQSIRYAWLFGAASADGTKDLAAMDVPKKSTFEHLERVAQAAFDEIDFDDGHSGPVISDEDVALLCERLARAFRSPDAAPSIEKELGIDPESGDGLVAFVRETVRAFTTYDLFMAVRILMNGATGSFGLSATCSVDAHRQVVLASRGQTMSLAFYPTLGTVLWGSELAALKAGFSRDTVDIDEEAESPDHSVVRLDLDDLGGEVCLVDYGAPDRKMTHSGGAHCRSARFFGGRVNVIIAEEDVYKLKTIESRLMRLQANPLVMPLPEGAVADPVGEDLREIPRAMRVLQEDWDGMGMNRMTAWCLGNDLIERQRAKGAPGGGSGGVDILITGIEVSLWVGEQFASDLNLIFPGLNIKCISSNKILSLLGQGFTCPAVGFPINSNNTVASATSNGNQTEWKLNDSIVIFISHTGGTFATLNCAALLQGLTSRFYAVTGEWDCQICRQIRRVDENSGKVFQSRVFSTYTGLRLAEPCSITVTVTHFLLTLLLSYLMSRAASDSRLESISDVCRVSTAAQLDDNARRSIRAISHIVGTSDSDGEELDREVGPVLDEDSTARKLRNLGRRWANHVLEVPLAFIMSFCYIVGTVTAGYPFLFGIWRAASGQSGGVGQEGGLDYMFLFFDSLIYCFVMQISCLLIRIIQRRPLLHRMGHRTIVIGDVPWVSQCVEAFTSKLFAVTYSATAITCFSGNPADHFVHRYTHRVVRGVLLAFGRPDGRLIDLTSLDQSVGLSLAQASYIRSLGTSAESVTIGHNPNKFQQTFAAVFLPSLRKPYLCELAVRDIDKKSIPRSPISLSIFKSRVLNPILGMSTRQSPTTDSMSDDSGSVSRSSQEYHSLYTNLTRDRSRKAFDLNALRTNSTDAWDVQEGVDVLLEEIMNFEESSRSKEGLAEQQQGAPGAAVDDDVRDEDDSRFHGQALLEAHPDEPLGVLIQKQTMSMHLYESRVASLERLVAFFVMFHAMGQRVESFWRYASLGLLAYDMSRSQSIMRIATTASPIAGGHVREKQKELTLTKQILKMRDTMKMLVANYRRRKGL